MATFTARLLGLPSVTIVSRPAAPTAEVTEKPAIPPDLIKNLGEALRKGDLDSFKTQIPLVDRVCNFNIDFTFMLDVQEMLQQKSVALKTKIEAIKIFSARKHGAYFSAPERILCLLDTLEGIVDCLKSGLIQLDNYERMKPILNHFASTHKPEMIRYLIYLGLKAEILEKWNKEGISDTAKHIVEGMRLPTQSQHINPEVCYWRNVFALHTQAVKDKKNCLALEAVEPWKGKISTYPKFFTVDQLSPVGKGITL